jgi:hypothetical protein
MTANINYVDQIVAALAERLDDCESICYASTPSSSW